MIKNDRQYRIAKSQLDKFARSVLEIDRQTKVHPLFVKAQKDAIESQLTDIRKEIEEYEQLKSSKPPILELRSIEELSLTLIKARIALGLSQRDLAERVKLKEQQIQRYEATDYESASVARVKELIKALGLRVAEDVQLPAGNISLGDFFQRISAAGLDREFVIKRLLSPTLAARLEDEDTDTAIDILAYQAAARIGRVYGWRPDQFFNAPKLELDTEPIATARFKVPKSVNKTKLHAYTVYAHYLALLITQASEHLPKKELSSDPYEIRDFIISKYGSLALEYVVRYFWESGVPVIALDDPGTFHGACFRTQHRNVIVLKHKTSSESRLMFDLFHEYWHATQYPDQAERTAVESEGAPIDTEEKTASQFAGAVLLGRDAPKFAKDCINEAHGDLRLLKGVVEKFALRKGISAGALANYLAFLLSLKGENWWGTAENLQEPAPSARMTIRNILLEYIDISRLPEPDLELLRQALSLGEMVVNG